MSAPLASSPPLSFPPFSERMRFPRSFRHLHFLNSKIRRTFFKSFPRYLLPEVNASLVFPSQPRSVCEGSPSSTACSTIPHFCDIDNPSYFLLSCGRSTEAQPHPCALHLSLQLRVTLSFFDEFAFLFIFLFPFPFFSESRHKMPLFPGCPWKVRTTVI